MVDRTRFSAKLLQNPEASSDAALERVALAKKRILSVLDRETVAHQKTLEKKISDQGPTPQRVDPHLIGLACMDLIEQRRVQKLTDAATGTKSWFALSGASSDAIRRRLDSLGPLYQSVSGGDFGNLTGDALEIIAFKCISKMYEDNKRFAYQGHFYLEQTKVNGRFRKVQPPKSIGGHTTNKEADFIQYGYDEGPICIECKNYREWLYPRDTIIKELIVKNYELGTIPVIIDRRIHYTARANLLFPAGIIAHESYYQYYPSDQEELASRVRDKRSLGFSDVMATEDPHDRTVKFFNTDLPKVITPMSKKWRDNRNALYDYANGEINLSQLYTAIGSPAGGKWVPDLDPDFPPGIE